MNLEDASVRFDLGGEGPDVTVDLVREDGSEIRREFGTADEFVRWLGEHAEPAGKHTASAGDTVQANVVRGGSE